MRHYRDFNSRLTPLDLKIFPCSSYRCFHWAGVHMASD
jgi:hypothetical protein